MFKCLKGKRLRQKYVKKLFKGAKIITVMVMLVSSFSLIPSVWALGNDYSADESSEVTDKVIQGESTKNVSETMQNTEENNRKLELVSASKTTYTAWIGTAGFATLKEAIASVTSGTNTIIELSEDQDLAETITISGGKNITITPKGKDIQIKRGTGLKSQMIIVKEASALNLGQNGMSHKLTIDGGGKSLSNNSSSSAIEINTLGTVSMYDGVIVQENASGKGAVLANNGNFFMHGGNIVNNADSALYKANGGVRVEGSNSACQFIMYGGTISDNDGSGVMVNSATGFVMENGSITRNVANNGGGVFVGTKFVMNGGEISHNKSTTVVSTNDDSAGGGGVRVHTSNSESEYFEMNGGKIVENTSAANGGGIHITGRVFLKGGEISNNYAQSHGGGVYKSNAFGSLPFAISGTTISHNVAKDSGGGIYANGLLNISKAIIKENVATKLGGGIFVGYNTTTSFIDGVITGNHAQSAGGIYNYGNLIIKGGKIVGNEASDKNGGGVSSNAGNTKLYLSGSPIIDENIAKKLGEGIYLGDTKLLIEESMGNDANIRLASNQGQLGAAIVESKAGYTLKESDLSCFSYDEELFWVGMDNGKGVLKNTIQSIASNIKATSITFGDTLSNSKISATVLDSDGNAIVGAWEFVDETVKPKATGEFSAVFIPNDKKYQSCKSDVNVIVLPKKVNYIVEHYQQNVTGSDYQLKDSEIVEGTVPEKVFAKAKEYLGFYENTTSSLRIPSGLVADDGSLVLKLYYDRNTFTVSFQSNGGTEIQSLQNIRYGNTISLLNPPVKEGYLFDGLYIDEELTEKWENGNLILENTILYVKWTKIIEIIPTPDIATPNPDKETSPSFNSNQGNQSGGQSVQTDEKENHLMELKILFGISTLLLIALFYQNKHQNDL